MDVREAIRLALDQIRVQKLKSFFGILGVLIGAMFLVTVVSVIEGMNRYMEEDFARRVYGLNTLTVRRLPSVSFEPSSDVWREWLRRPRLRIEDAEALDRQLDIPALIAVSSMRTGNLVGPDGTEIENVWVTGASAEFFRIRDYEVEYGRLFTQPEDRQGAPVIVLGAETAAALFGSRDPIGRRVRLNGFPFRVIGVLERQGSLFGMSLDNQAIAPARSAVARFVNPHRVVDEILVRTLDHEAMAAAMLDMEAILRMRRRLRPAEPNNFEIETAEESMTFWQTISRILFVAFPGLVAISLVVGGMVITNIMLVSVTERTREIGIRKAVGARRRDIVRQVLIESATLSAFGAGGGILLGAALAGVVRQISPLPAVLAPHWMVLAAVVGIGVGVTAGVYPAARAAKLDPVVALGKE